MARSFRGRRATGATAPAGATEGTSASHYPGAGASGLHPSGAPEERGPRRSDGVRLVGLAAAVAVTLAAVARGLASLIDRSLHGTTAFAVAGAAAFMLAGGLQVAAAALAFRRAAPPAAIRLAIVALLVVAILVDLVVLYSTWHTHRYAGFAT